MQGKPLIVYRRVGLKENRGWISDSVSAFACGASETAGPRSTSLRAGFSRLPPRPPTADWFAASAAPKRFDGKKSNFERWIIDFGATTPPVALPSGSQKLLSLRG